MVNKKWYTYLTSDKNRQTKIIWQWLTWNFENSSAFSSSLAMMSLTTCCGRRANEPRFSTSLPCSSTNSRTLEIERTRL